MAPAVKRLLPPASLSGARSSTSTETPCSAAASAAQNAALPAPTTTTSLDSGSIGFPARARSTRGPLLPYRLGMVIGAKEILFERRGVAAIVTLNRPPALKALSRVMVLALRAPLGGGG